MVDWLANLYNTLPPEVSSRIQAQRSLLSPAPDVQPDATLWATPVSGSSFLSDAQSRIGDLVRSFGGVSPFDNPDVQKRFADLDLSGPDPRQEFISQKLPPEWHGGPAPDSPAGALDVPVPPVGAVGDIPGAPVSVPVTESAHTGRTPAMRAKPRRRTQSVF